MSSEEIYFPYYKPTDVSHPNKVLYTDNMGSNYDIIITGPNGMVNLNEKGVLDYNYSSDEYINDYIYSVSVTNGFKYNSTYVTSNKFQTLSEFSSIADTIARQINIDNFNYDTIFGLTVANPSVIDYNYYSAENETNVFSMSQSITNKEITKIGPKLFLYTTSTTGNKNDYVNGIMNATLTTSDNINIFSSDADSSNVNNILSYNGKTLASLDGISVVNINDTAILYDLEVHWPYKIQYNDDQYYHMLTNGRKTALLTLPYETSTSDTYYLLDVRSLNNNQVYNYKKLDEIVENNYYYIVSYFDTRPTIKNKNTISFSSKSSSLFDENNIQFMPLVYFYPQMVYLLHDESNASNIASCNPVSFTTTTGHTLISPGTYNGVEVNKSNYGLNPLQLTWDKNLTITTTLNYTCANMVNLSDTLTGWNYLNQNLDSTKDIISRPNMPYINVGLLIYIPTTDEPYIQSNNQLNSNNHFIRFYNWLSEFGWDNFWDFVDDNASNRVSMADQFTNIYNTINVASSNQDSFDSTFVSLSTPACLNFNINQNTVSSSESYNDHLDVSNIDFNNNVNFLDLNVNNTSDTNVRDVIKCVTVMSVPINNALNTTHTVSDTFTFRLDKQNSAILGDYYYIIGTYIYLTKGVQATLSLQNKHYLGFSPSTNILGLNLFQEQIGSQIIYNYPKKCINSFLTDTSNPFINTYLDSRNVYRNSLMKDMFITPSLFMTINESVGDI